MKNDFLDCMIPRFITERCALEWDGEQYQPVCSMNDVMHGEAFDAVGTIRSFNFFGFGLFAALDLDTVVPWSERERS